MSAEEEAKADLAVSLFILKGNVHQPLFHLVFINASPYIFFMGFKTVDCTLQYKCITACPGAIYTVFDRRRGKPGQQCTGGAY